MSAPAAPPLRHSAAIRFTELDAFRGVAALIVVITHLYPKPMFWSWVVMDMFFVMSSFLITRIALRQVVDARGLLAFWGRRIERIWPLYMLTVWGILLLAWLISSSGGKQYDLSQFWRYFTFSQHTEHLFGDVPESLPIDMATHLWSLGVEEQFYILLPILVLASRYVRYELWIAVLLCGLPIAIYQREVNLHIVIISNHLDAFSIGALMAIWLQWMEEQRRFTNTVLTIVLAISLLGFLPYLTSNYTAYFAGQAAKKYQALPAFFGVYLMGSCIGLMAINRGAPWLAAMRWPPLVFLGVISYPLYLAHFPVLVLAPRYLPKIIDRLGLPPVPHFVIDLISLLIFAVVTMLLYRLIDQKVQGGRTAPGTAKPA